jgi:amino acid transporter
VYLSGVIYGISFILLGTVAGNSIAFSLRVLEAADVTPSNSAVRGLAIAAATGSCFVHMVSRRGGIWLSIAFAAIKVAIMLLIIILGICAYSGVFHQPTYAVENLAPSKSFRDASSDPYGYAAAFMSVLWAYSGFDQPNYVSVDRSLSKLHSDKSN